MTLTASQKPTPKAKAKSPHVSPKKTAKAIKSAPLTEPSVISSRHSTIIAMVPNKQSRLIELLQRPAGATLTELMNATGWQAHSIRGVISGVLRKKLGLVVTLTRDESGERRYDIPSNTSTAGGNVDAAVSA